MAPLFIPPVVAGALGVLGAVALVKLVKREWHRVNAELYPPAASDRAADRREATKLTRDPTTGVYRPE